MLILTPLQEIEEKYSRIRSVETYERALRRCLTKGGRKQFEHLRQSREIPEFYDFACERGLNGLFRYEALGLSRILVPGVLEVVESSKRVLDVGCFDGLHTTLYALNMPNSYLVGIDLSRRSLRAARANAKKYNCNNVRFTCSDVRHLPFRNHFDAIVATNVLHETPEIVQDTGLYRDYALEDKFRSIRKSAIDGAKLFLSLSLPVEEWRSYILTYLQESGFGDFKEAKIEYKSFGEVNTCLLVRAKAL